MTSQGGGTRLPAETKRELRGEAGTGTRGAAVPDCPLGQVTCWNKGG